MRRRVRGDRARRRRGRDAATPTQKVVRRLKEHAAPRRFWCEEYGPDGEIEEAREWRPVPGGRMDFYVVTCTDYAEPKTDWRERGVVPRLGIHPLGEAERR